MRTLIALVFMTAILLFPAWGQNTAACTTATTRGTYSVVCTGFISPAPGTPQVPLSILGTVTGDFSGNFTGTAKASIGGTIADQSVTGTLVSNGDCTGSITYVQKINGQPAPNLNIVTHTLDDGKEIRGMSVDAGATMSCTLRLMNRSDLVSPAAIGAEGTQAVK